MCFGLCDNSGRDRPSNSPIIGGNHRWGLTHSISSDISHYKVVTNLLVQATQLMKDS